MSSYPRPVLLGYIRTDVLGAAGVHRAQAELATFADREEYTLGTVYVAQDNQPGAFHSLMDELADDDSAWGVVVPDLRHLTVVEHLVLRRREDGARTPVVVARHCPEASS